MNTNLSRGLRFGLFTLLAIELTSNSHAAQRKFTVRDDIELTSFNSASSEQAPIVFSPNRLFVAVYSERGLLDRDRPESTVRIYKIADVRRSLKGAADQVAPRPYWVISKATYKDGPIISNLRWLKDSSALAFLARTSTGEQQLFLADISKQTLLPLSRSDEDVTAFDIQDSNNYVYTVVSAEIHKRAASDSQAVAIVGNGREFDTLIDPGLEWRNYDFEFDLSNLFAVINGRKTLVRSSASGEPMVVYRYGERALSLSPDGHRIATILPVADIPPTWEELFPPPIPGYSIRIRAGTQDLHAFDGRRYVGQYSIVEIPSGKIDFQTNAPIGEAGGWWLTSKSDNDIGPLLTADWSSDGALVMLSNTYLSPVGNTSSYPKTPCIAVVDLIKKSVACLEELSSPLRTGAAEKGSRSYITSLRFQPHSHDAEVEYLLPGDRAQIRNYKQAANGEWQRSVTDLGPDERNDLWVYVEQDLNVPAVLVAADKRRNVSRIVLDPNPQLKEIALGDASIFEWGDRLGHKWRGGLYKPPAYTAGKKYPLVIQTHGFLEHVFRPNGMYASGFAARELAAEGILVLQVPYCSNIGTPEEGLCNVAEYEGAVTKLNQLGIIDPDRVGIIGFSRSGYWVLDAVESSTIRFRAAAITDGYTAGYMQYMIAIDFQGDVIPHDLDSVMGAAPFDGGLHQWLHKSPLFNIEKVKIPLRITAIGRHSVLEMWEPYAALRYLGHPVELIAQRDGTHILTNPTEQFVAQQGTVDWFRFWLKGEEDAVPEKAEQYARWRGLRDLQNANAETSPGGGSTGQ
jgi:poly(3-hydroxybutyrate) depolymerase